MLQKKKRVTKELFQTIMEKGEIISSPFFVFRYVKNSIPQYAFVAPKGIVKKASSRNALRRKGYNILRVYTLKNVAGIFFYKKQAVSASISEIKEDINIILNKIRP
ncbi:ribonuclease P protein component [Candidatus Nomurabacteria bacterium]|nr:ribonuclease P protein component [Candidatus Nomurabacteria bacterium]